MDPLRQSAHRQFMVAGAGDPGALRRELTGQVLRNGASSDGCARVQLAATELASNLLEHAKPGGYVLSRMLPGARIELIAVDCGPGMTDPGAALGGRTVPAAGLGCGLAAVRRASALFDLYTVPGHGTAVLSVIDLAPSRQRPLPAFRGVAAVSVAIAEQCGDAWAVAPVDGGIAVAVIDGLGHGTAASAAADAAISAFAAQPGDLAGFVPRANLAMRDTRGGATTVCVMHPDQGVLEYLAIGNVNGRMLAPANRRNLVTYPGTLGLKAAPPTVRLQTCPWPGDAVLVLWTDGLLSTVSGLPDDPDLAARDPALLAATLHRDYGTGRDDATVVVIRAPGGP